MDGKVRPMDVYWVILFFISGAVFGSFFNVIGLRIPMRLSFSNDRSYCPVCKSQLKAYELIPVISYIFLKGKCRYCGSRISKIYPFIEMFTGFLFAYSYWKIDLTVEMVTILIFISMLMILLVTDVVYMLIPNKILLFFLPFIIIMRFVSPLDPWYDAIIGSAVGFFAIAGIILLSNGGMGSGDMKLFTVLGIVLGWKNTLLTLFLGSLLGLLTGGTMLLFKKTDRKQPIPFGPYIIIAALISYFYGEEMIAMYMALF